MTGVMVKLLRQIQEFHMRLLLSNSKRKTSQSLSEVRKNGKHGLRTLTTGVMVRLLLPIPESHINLLFNSRTNQLLLEEKRNIKHGPKTSTTGAMVKLMLPTPESHMLQLSWTQLPLIQRVNRPGWKMPVISSKSKMSQSLSEVRKNTKLGLKTSTTGVMVKPMLPTVESHMLQPFWTPLL